MEEQQGGGAGKEYWFAQDGLGSTAAVTKQDGQSAHDYFYDPYGGIIDDNGHPEDSSNWTDPHNHYLLTGKEWDEESRLYYPSTALRASFGARYYDAAVGVWLTQDVYRGQVEQPLTLHRTLYVAANPVNHVDAYGYRVSANGYGDSGGGSTPISPPLPVPVNSSQPGNFPCKWVDKPSGGGESWGKCGGGGGGGPDDDMPWWPTPEGWENAGAWPELYDHVDFAWPWIREHREDLIAAARRHGFYTTGTPEEQQIVYAMAAVVYTESVGNRTVFRQFGEPVLNFLLAPSTHEDYIYLENVPFVGPFFLQQFPFWLLT